MPPTSTIWLCATELVVWSRAALELGELEVGAKVGVASARAAFPDWTWPSAQLLYVDVEIQSIFTTLPASPEPTASIVHQAKAGPKGLPQLAHHTAMIFGSDGGPRPAYFPAATSTRDEYTQSERHKHHTALHSHLQHAGPGCCQTPTGAADGSASGADNKFDNDDAGNEEVSMPFLLSSSIFLLFLLFLPLPCIWPRANAPWLG